jgi:RHS repeat-associated protein
MQTDFIYDCTPSFVHSYVLTASRYTGKERDTESGNDYFGARFYSSNMGRFMSPDWSAKQEPVPYSKLDNPQSLNLYGYTLNNPLSNVDTDGHACSGILGNTGGGFCTRATEYGMIDGKCGGSLPDSVLCCCIRRLVSAC